MSYPYPSLQMNPPSGMQGSPYTNDPYAPQQQPMRGGYGNSGMMIPPGEEEPLDPEMMTGQGLMPAYAQGGHVSSQDSAPLSPLAQMLAGQGRAGDTMLAHINPLEAMLLKSLGGSGTRNPQTGLPEFSNPFVRFLKKIVAPVGGALLGNFLLPGLGSMIGGGLGGMLGHPNQRLGPLGGLGIGAFAPMAMSGIGNILGKAGLPDMSSFFGKIGGQTANPLTSMLMPGQVSTSSEPGLLSSLMGSSQGKGGEGFLSAVGKSASGKEAEGLGGYLGQFLKPKNVIPLASLGYTAFTTPSPERQYKAQYQAQAEAQKYLDDQLHQADRVKMIARGEREAEREKWEPLAHSEDVYETEQASPEEYERTGKWFKKYKKDAQGRRIEVPYAQGGRVRGYLEGDTGGQDDKVRALLSHGEYVIDAPTVSALGDGNNRAGAKLLDQLRRQIQDAQRHSGQRHPRQEILMNTQDSPLLQMMMGRA